MGTTLLLGGACALAFFGLRLYLTLLFARVLRERAQLDWWASLIGGWLMVTALHLCLVLGLSAIEAMRRPALLALAVVSTAVPAWMLRGGRLLPSAANLPKAAWPPLVAGFVVLVAMTLRAFFIPDMTRDAQDYGLPRIGLWMHAGSVFLHMPAVQLNLFVNEWNAELLGTAYAVVAGGFVGVGFANVEVLLLLLAATAWVARLMGAGLAWGLGLAVVVASAPAMLGLATTVKGDLLACAAFMAAFGWFLLIRRGDRSQVAFAMLLLSAALASGAKLTVLVPVAAVFVLALHAYGWRKVPLRWNAFWAVTAVGLLVFTARFWTNLAVYANPVKRAGVERVEFALSNLGANALLSAKRMFAVWDEMVGHVQVWALSGTMGASAWFIVIAALAGWVLLRRQRPPAAGPAWASIGAVLVATAALMVLYGERPWSFRYFAPGILVALVGLGAAGLRGEGKLQSAVAMLAVVAVAVNLKVTSQKGEVVPYPFATLIPELAQVKSPRERMRVVQKGEYAGAGVDTLGLDGARSLEILIFKDYFSPLLPFLGTRAQNHISLVASPADLVKAAECDDWDVVVVGLHSSLRDPALAASLGQRGYRVVMENEAYLIALPGKRFDTLVDGAEALAWTPWNGRPGVTTKLHGGWPQVESGELADAGFTTSAIGGGGPLLFEARFEGEIAGPGRHAAHVSIHGTHLVIALPPGRYRPEQVFRKIVDSGPPGAKQSLSFGLGGWGKGSGRIRLAGLRVSRLRHSNCGDWGHCRHASAGTP